MASAQDSQQDPEISAAEETASPLDESGRLVRFERDIAPILRAACLECHGPEDAKNDFRVDDPEVLMEYIEPEDVESSSIFIDYLTIDDEDMLMPPESHGGPLKPGELALIRVWIEEGANWPEGYQLVADVSRRGQSSQSWSQPRRRFPNEFGRPKVSSIRRRFISRSHCFSSVVDSSCWVGNGHRWEPRFRWLVCCWEPYRRSHRPQWDGRLRPNRDSEADGTFSIGAERSTFIAGAD